MRSLTERERVDLLAYLHRTPLAVAPQYLGAVLALANGRLDVAERQLEVRTARGPERAGVGADAPAVAFIPIIGAITHRANCLSEFLGLASVEEIRANFRAALADPTVGAILFDIDSPGGEVAGIADLAAEIRAARGRKPMVAIANEAMFSAAYWLGSAADRVVLTQTAGAGSIGVIAMHVDQSEALAAQGLKVTVVKSGTKKAQYNALEPLSDEARADLDAEVNALATLFMRHVAAVREGVDVDALRAMEGGTFTGKAAVTAGLADAVTTMSAEVARLTRDIARPAPRASTTTAITTTITEHAAGALQEERPMSTEASAPETDPKVVAITTAAEARATAAERERQGSIRRLFGAMTHGATANEAAALAARCEELCASNATIAEASDALVTLRASFQSSTEIRSTHEAGARTDAPSALRKDGSPCATTYPDPHAIYADRRLAMQAAR